MNLYLNFMLRTKTAQWTFQINENENPNLECNSKALAKKYTPRNRRFLGNSKNNFS